MRAIALGLGFALAACAHGPVAPDRSVDEAAVRAVIGQLVSSWNAKDAAGFSSSFAERHDYVAVDGQLRLDLTPAGNTAAHEQVWRFVYPEGSTIRMDVKSVRFPARDVAVVQAANHNEFTRGGQKQTLTSSLTGVLVREGGAWKITAFNNNVGQGGSPLAGRPG